ncbi:MAG: hypothetical protein AAF415_20785 [Pseudomonadota bacterium]
MRSPISALDHEKMPGIGHNQGPPLESGHGFRVFAWKKARAQLMPKLPLEILKRRVARAKDLGLAYPQYASILLGTGRDVVAFLFTSEAIGLRLARGGEIAEPARAKLSEIDAARLLMTDPADDPIAVGAMLAGRYRLEMHGIGPAPQPNADRKTGTRAIRALLDPQKRPGDTVVMIGTQACERDWADAARLAKFLPASAYFG